MGLGGICCGRAQLPPLLRERDPLLELAGGSQEVPAQGHSQSFCTGFEASSYGAFPAALGRGLHVLMGLTGPQFF